MRNIYTFNSGTGEYTGAGDAYIDPLTGATLLPPNATYTPPPTPIPGHARIYSAGEWQQVEDHRGELFFSLADREFRTVEQLGPIPLGHVPVSADIHQDYSLHPDHYSVTDYSMVKLSGGEIAALEAEKLKDAKIHERAELFATVDWRMMRSDDQALLNIPQSDDPHTLASYRQYLREFDRPSDWWLINMLTYAEYRAGAQQSASQDDAAVQIDQSTAEGHQ
jgi:hypothetical protein